MTYVNTHITSRLRYRIFPSFHKVLLWPFPINNFPNRSNHYSYFCHHRLWQWIQSLKLKNKIEIIYNFKTDVNQLGCVLLHEGKQTLKLIKIEVLTMKHKTKTIVVDRSKMDLIKQREHVKVIVLPSHWDPSAINVCAWRVGSNLLVHMDIHPMTQHPFLERLSLDGGSSVPPTS